MLDQCVVRSYTSTEFYFDISKEMFLFGLPLAAMSQESTSSVHEPGLGDQAQMLPWKRCCLNSRCLWASSRWASSNNLHVGLLEDASSLTLESHSASWSRRAGLLYSQFRGSTKEIFAAEIIYTFTKSALEGLALVAQLRKTWHAVGGSLSLNLVALIRAFLYTKRRCRLALQGPQQKSFRVREERCVSQRLHEQIRVEFLQRELHLAHQLGFIFQSTLFDIQTWWSNALSRRYQNPQVLD